MKFQDMTYTRVTPQEVAPQMAELTRRMREEPTAAGALDAFFAYQKLSDRLYTMESLSYARFSLNTADAFYSAENDFYDENTPLFQELVQTFYKALVTSPHRAALEGELGSLLFLNIELEMKAFDPKIVPDLQEENRLVTAYSKLIASAAIAFDGKTLNLSQMTPYEQSPDRAVREAAVRAKAGFFLSHGEEFDRIFDDLVKVRTRMARALGFENFVEMGYCRMGRNCYNAADVEAFRQNVKQYIVPVVQKLKAAQAGRLGLSSLMVYDDALMFPSGNAKPKGTPEEIFAHGKTMYHELSPETAEFIDFMLANDLFDVLARPGKMAGGYCTNLPDYGSPFIFANFNGTSGDIDVLTHEAGHALANFLSRNDRIGELRQPTLESCEVHSMSMEFFTWPWMNGFFAEQTEKYHYAHLSDALIFLPYGVIVDAFQHKIYAEPDMTPKQRKDCWLSLEAGFRPWLGLDGVPFYGEGGRWQAQGHIYERPFYYIDYCLAQTVALDFWAAMQDDYKDAWRRYLALVKKGGHNTFNELVTGADFPLPFEHGALETVATAATKWLETKSPV